MYALMLVTVLSFNSNLVKVKEVKYPEHCFSGIPLAFTVSPNGDLIGMFQMDHPFIARLDGTFSNIRPFGQGPSDLQSLMGTATEADLLYVIEFGGSFKTFKRKGSNYEYLSLSKLKSGYRPPIEQGLVVTGDYIWVGGYLNRNPEKWTETSDITPLQVFDKTGAPIKQLATFKFNPKRNHYDMAFFFALNADEVVCAREDEIKLRRFSTKNFRELPPVQLPLPDSYLSIPDDFYAFDKSSSEKHIMDKLLFYRKGYSRICAMVATSKGVFVQFRNHNTKRATYTVFRLNPQSYKKTGAYTTNDLLLSGKADKLYFHKDGDPSQDEADCFTLAIYEVRL